MRRFCICILAAAFCCQLLMGQDYIVPELEAALREDPVRAGGNLYPYHHGDLHDTPAPRGYKPFYISHYGRHGSRHVAGADNYNLVKQVLYKADSLGILSEKGREVLAETEAVENAWDGMDGRLSPRGVEEHKGIAHRMVKRFPEVFKGKPKIRARSSTVQRCLVSMAAFTSAMASDRPKAEWSFDTGEKIMKIIGDTGKATPDVDELRGTIKERKWNISKNYGYVLGRLFTDSLAASRLVPDLRNFNRALFRIGSISKCWDIEDHIMAELPFEYLYIKYSDAAHYDFAKYGNSAEISRERFASMNKLWADLVSKADEAIAGSGYAADLRFGHDWPISLLTAYIGVEGPGSKLYYNELDKYWWEWRELCMASNLQMVLYRNKAGHVLVKFLYQEQERMLRGLESVSGPYYDWETVRANIQGFRR